MRIQYHMAEQHVSREMLANACGCTKSLISSYIHGRCKEENMDISVLKDMAKYLKKETYYFCNEYLFFLDTEDVPECLREIRRKVAISQRKFAKLHDISLHRYKTYESGKVRLQYDAWKKLFC